MRDTSSAAAAVQIAAFRRLSPEQRVALAFEASEWLLRVARARPTATPTPPTPAVGSATTRSVAELDVAMEWKAVAEEVARDG